MKNLLQTCESRRLGSPWEEAAEGADSIRRYVEALPSAKHSAVVCMPLAMPVSYIADCLSRRRSDCDHSRFGDTQDGVRSDAHLPRSGAFSVPLSTAELETRRSAGTIITKDQLLNLAAELHPAESPRELISY